MSLLGAKTKKVTTYGSKRTRIINVHADLSLDQPSPPKATDAKTEPELDCGPSSTPPPVKRQPLQAKRRVEVVIPKRKSTAGTSDAPVKSTKPPKAALLKSTQPVQPTRKTRSVTPEENVVPRQYLARRPGKTVIPRSPLSTPPRSRVNSTRGRELRDVAAPSPLRVVADGAGVGLAKRLARLTLDKKRSDEELRQNDREKSKRLKKETDEVGRREDKRKNDKRSKGDKPSRPLMTRTQQRAAELAQLLASCNSSESLSFDSIFTSPAFAPVLPATASIVHKIGEASYSEVFSVSADGDSDPVILKIIPLTGPNRIRPKKLTFDVPECSEILDVLREIEITKRMAEVPGGGFVDFVGAFVVHGGYPERLMAEWDRYKEDQGSESIRPDVFSESQEYVLIALRDGGVDLEKFQFEGVRGWVQAASVFWQVADALARAEQWTSFEHRDLHEGQILVAPVEIEGTLGPVDNYLDTDATAVRATVIDFGLSRLEVPGGVRSTPPQADVYDGVGDQWDVYRAMRRLVNGTSSTSSSDDDSDYDSDDDSDYDDNDPEAWAAFHPGTNVLWLRYLVRRLLRATPSLRKPYARRESMAGPGLNRLMSTRGAAVAGTVRARTAKPGGKAAAAAAAKEAVRARADAAWAMLNDVECALAAGPSGQDAPRSRARSTRGTSATARLESAEAFMAWGRAKGWIA